MWNFSNRGVLVKTLCLTKEDGKLSGFSDDDYLELSEIIARDNFEADVTLLDFGSRTTLLTQVQRFQITAVAGVSIESNLPQELITEFSAVPHLDDNRNVSGPSVENGLRVKNGMHSILLDRGTDFLLSTFDDQIWIDSCKKVTFLLLFCF